MIIPFPDNCFVVADGRKQWWWNVQRTGIRQMARRVRSAIRQKAVDHFERAFVGVVIQNRGYT